jgi:hypothetical protein
MAIFGQMDKNGSGAVDFKEIKAHSSKNGGQVTLNPKPWTLNLNLWTLNPKP